jgi:hypothetical protein
MNRAVRRLFFLALAVTAGSFAMLCSDRGDTAMVSTAEAVIGRPLTPMSYAGVARRTTRRAVAVGAGAAAAGAYVATPGCVQVVDAYGRIVTRCR